MNRLKTIALPLALVFTAVFFSACEKKAPDTADAAPIQMEEELMKQGVQLLYTNGDPVAAEQMFKNVLERNPAHYGAHFQRAVALDRSARPAEARPVWTEVLKLAEGIGDTAVASQARQRLAIPDTASVEALMVLGLDLMNRQNNPVKAAEQFRAILQRNPTHYGATFQLATALDRANLQADARPLWVKVLGMAESYKDSATARTARDRLK